VRPARPSDASGIAALWGEIRSASNGAGSLVAAPADDRVLKALEAIEADEGARLLVAEADDPAGAIVGMAVLQHHPLAPLFDVDSLQVSYLHVARSWQGRGVGKALLAEAAALAEAGHLEHVVVSVFPGARDDHRFYARLGFAPMATRRVVATTVLRRKLGGQPGASRLEGMLARRRVLRARGTAQTDPVGG
jgi:GNAT superfamily N-acetyltransferase